MEERWNKKRERVEGGGEMEKRRGRGKKGREEGAKSERKRGKKRKKNNVSALSYALKLGVANLRYGNGCISVVLYNSFTGAV